MHSHPRRPASMGASSQLHPSTHNPHPIQPHGAPPYQEVDLLTSNAVATTSAAPAFADNFVSTSNIIPTSSSHGQLQWSGVPRPGNPFPNPNRPAHQQAIATTATTTTTGKEILLPTSYSQQGLDSATVPSNSVVGSASSRPSSSPTGVLPSQAHLSKSNEGEKSPANANS